MAGAPGLISSQFVVCEPSSAARNAPAVLRFAEGGSWHRLVLKDRIGLASNAPPHARAAWTDRQACQSSDDTVYGSPFVTETTKAKIREASAARARLTQGDLDALTGPLCRCAHYRQDSQASAAWKQIMPQVVCDAIRRERNQAQQATT